jgi:formylglycine-generating enzyme required for sulfatase activity
MPQTNASSNTENIDHLSRGLLGDIGIAMVPIPAGSFLMGSPSDERGRGDNEGPQHMVHLNEFFLTQTPVTQAQWKAMAQWTPPEDEDAWPWSLPLDPVSKLNGADRFLGEQQPVVNVSWYEAMEFCRRLSQRFGRHYTLPSEAQWEYACRAGTEAPFHFGDMITPEVANYFCAASYANGPTGEPHDQTTPVGMFPGNTWGLHDMHGNVEEWCLDLWHRSYDGAPTNGIPWRSDGDLELMSLRGGSWFSFPAGCRSAARGYDIPRAACSQIGFRVACLPQVSALPHRGAYHYK